jgi:uncharacterized protein (DUF1778 family)
MPARRFGKDGRLTALVKFEGLEAVMVGDAAERQGLSLRQFALRAVLEVARTVNAQATKSHSGRRTA